ncbi:MAG TPA: hypothetical protein PKG88_04810 [Bacteroidales bacterium]|nr:hypothetical protein [Bacteroidales bacterium]HPS71193.1 hypothetical protein [Bacteroidales bacterium]
MNSIFKNFLIVVVLATINFAAVAQNETDPTSGDTIVKKKWSLNVGADLMSRYVWRGTDYGDSPSIQPYLSLAYKNFEIGCWNSFSATNKYREIDLYVKYTINRFSITLTDYYIPYNNGNPASPDIRYFAYQNQTTAHTFEAALQYKGSEKYPFWIMGGVFFYGNDKRWGYQPELDTTNKTYFSSYFEAGYTFSIKDNNLDVFAGITPMAGAFGNSFGVVNLGITAYKSIKINKDYSLPVKGSLIFNPQANAAHFVFGISL